MGAGFTAKCKKCGFLFDVFYGVGFLYPETYTEAIEEAKNGKYGEEIKSFLEIHSDAAINAERVVMQCEECKNLEIGDDLSVFLPKNKDSDGEKEKLIWSIAFPAEGYKFVAPWELKENYIKMIEYSHKCSKCSGNMKIIPEEELNSLCCPKCGGEMEDVGRIYWD